MLLLKAFLKLSIFLIYYCIKHVNIHFGSMINIGGFESGNEKEKR
jgi:hypothetical protein